MPRRLLLVLIGLAVFLAACLGHPTEGGGPVPVPVNLASPDALSQGLAQTRIPWWIEEGGTQQGVYIRLDGTDPQSIPTPEYAVGGARSPSGRYFAYGTSPLPGGDIELLHVATGERSTLVYGEARFPGARLTSLAFSYDEQAVVFEVAAEDRTDLAFVDLASRQVRFLDLQGTYNMWPEVSPDGRWILVACEGRQPGAGFVLCLLDQEQNTRTYLVDEALNLMPGSRFTADGRSVVYVAPVGGIDGEGQLYRIDIDDREKHLLVSGLHPVDVVLGVASEEVIFTCTYPEEPTCKWVCVARLDGSDVRRLT